jgi:hypothetical protein
MAKIDDEAARKARSDAARKAGIQARNDKAFAEAKAAREKKAEPAAKAAVAAPKASLTVDGEWAP